MTPLRTSLVVLCVAATLAGCGTDHSPGPGEVRAEQDRSLLSPYGEKVSPAESDRRRGAADDSSAVSAPAGAPAPLAEAPNGSRSAKSPTQEAALRAGFVDDNDSFAAYQDFVAAYSGPARDLVVSSRKVVTVTDANGLPLLGARITAGDESVLSHVDGRALLFDAPAGATVTVTYGEATTTGVLAPDDSTTIALDTARVDAAGLTVDLDLVLDTTGSMGDEIDQLNASLQEIAIRLDALDSEPEVRYGLTVYRDHGDAYVFRTHDFTDLETFSKELANTGADGGGDTPEALDEAFHASVNGPTWGQDTSHVELMLLVSDAPSHMRDDQGATGFAADVAAARERGIEVVPLAASGADDSAEFEFRQLAQQTLGTFFFLTYGADGSPGDETTNHVSDYATGSLADMVVDHVSARLDTYADPVGDAPSDTPTEDPTTQPTDQQQPTQ